MDFFKFRHMAITLGPRLGSVVSVHPSGGVHCPAVLFRYILFYFHVSYNSPVPQPEEWAGAWMDMEISKIDSCISVLIRVRGLWRCPFKSGRSELISQFIRSTLLRPIFSPLESLQLKLVISTSMYLGTSQTNNFLARESALSICPYYAIWLKKRKLSDLEGT